MYIKLTAKYLRSGEKEKLVSRISLGNIFLPYVLDLLVTMKEFNRTNTNNKINFDSETIEDLVVRGQISPIQQCLLEILMCIYDDEYEENVSKFLVAFDYVPMEEFYDFLEELKDIFSFTGSPEYYTLENFKLKIKCPKE